MTEFLTAHPYLCFSTYVVSLLFLTVWVGMVLSTRKAKREANTKQPTVDHDVYLGELELDEAVLHCQEIAEKNEGTICGKNHTILALWLEELMHRRSQSDVGKRGFAAGVEAEPNEPTVGGKAGG